MHGRFTRFGLAALLLSFLAIFPAAAQAQAKKDDPKAEALQLFNQSADLYREGKFDEAARLLERAYELHPEPVLLYNLARAYDGLGENQKAVDAYKRYLELAPKAKDRGALERRIATLQEQIEKDRKKSETVPEKKPVTPEPTPEKPKPESSGPGIWPWVVIGAGAATVTGGLVVGLMAKNKREDADGNPVNREAANEFNEAENLAGTANILLIAGTVITAGGVTWMILGAKSKKQEAAQLHLRVLPMGVSFGGRL